VAVIEQRRWATVPDPDTAAFGKAVRRRDEPSHFRDDTGAAGELTRSGITLIRGTGRVTGPGTVQIKSRRSGTRIW